MPGGLPRYRHYNESLNILEALAGGRIDLQASGGVGWGPKLQIACVRVTILRCQACTCSLCPCQTTPPPLPVVLQAAQCSTGEARLALLPPSTSAGVAAKE